MAPEAALGNVQEIDARADVYSLGAILHRILTGDFPFEFKTFPEYVRKLLKGVTEIAGTPPGLGRICLKALARDKADRYETVGALADALRAWQRESAIDREVDALSTEGEATLAAAEGLEGDALVRQLDRAMAMSVRILELRPDNERAEALGNRAREMRAGAMAQRERAARSRLLRRVGVVGLVAATAATLLVAFLLDDKRRDAESARVREEAQRVRAEKQRAAAESLADFMIHDLHDGLVSVGRLDLLAQVSRKSLEYYRGLPIEDVSDEVRASRALALGRIGEVLVASGDLDEALATCVESQTVYETLVAAAPTNREWQQGLATALNRTGDVHQETGDLDAALAVFRRSAEIRRRLDDEQDLTRSLDRVATILVRRGERDTARALYLESLRIRRRLATQSPEDLDTRAALAKSLEHVGDIALQTDGLSAGVEHYEECLAIRQQLRTEQPDDPERQAEVASVVFRIAHCRGLAGDAAAALEGYRQSLVIYRRLVDLDPSKSFWQRNLSLSLGRVAGRLKDAGDTDGARAHFVEALDVKRRLARRDPSNTRAQHDVGTALIGLADLAKSANQIPEALVSYNEALAIARQLVALDDVNTEWQSDLTTALSRIGQIRHHTGRHEAARKDLEEGLSVALALTQRDAANVEWQSEVALAHDRLGALAQDMKDQPRALVHFTQSVDVRRRIVGLDAQNLAAAASLAWALGKLGSTARTLGDGEAALAYFTESLPIHRDIATRDATPSRRRELALSLYNIGTGRESAGRQDDALLALREAEWIHAHIAAYANEHRYWAEAYQRVLAAVGPSEAYDHLTIGYGLYAEKDFAAAAAEFARGLKNESLRADLARGHLYNGVCAAALAGEHDKALEWLTEDLRRRREEMPPALFAAHLTHAMSNDPDLASLRELDSFQRLFAGD